MIFKSISKINYLAQDLELIEVMEFLHIHRIQSTILLFHTVEHLCTPIGICTTRLRTSYHFQRFCNCFVPHGKICSMSNHCSNCSLHCHTRRNGQCFTLVRMLLNQLVSLLDKLLHKLPYACYWLHPCQVL